MAFSDFLWESTPPCVAGAEGSAPGSRSWGEGQESKGYAGPGPQALSRKAQ